MSPGCIVIDLETTGLDPAADEILQVGITDLQGRELWCRHYSPRSIKAWPDAEAINGITPADVAGCPAASEDADAIQAIIAAAQRVCIYNAAFDAPFLVAVGVSFGDVELHDALEDCRRAAHVQRWCDAQREAASGQ